MMRIEDFLAHHQLRNNPFANAEEAQGDSVLMRLLEQRDYQFGHPQWPKFLGVPPGTQTSIVFGLKGSGKTAMRLALVSSLAAHNEKAPDDKALLVDYTEFNDYLDNWKRSASNTLSSQRSAWQRFFRRSAQPVALNHWHLAQHVDAIIAQTMLQLESLLSAKGVNPRRWPAHVKADAMFLSAVYMPTRSLEYREAQRRVHRRLYGPLARLGGALGYLLAGTLSLGTLILIKYARARSLVQHLVQNVQPIEPNEREKVDVLHSMSMRYLKNQPLAAPSVTPDHESSRYEMLNRLVRICRLCGYERLVVVIDKIDEPTYVSGDYERMADFIKPLWNNKLLQTDGLHFKMLIPAQLHKTIRKADERLLNTARLDKMNRIYPFTWSGTHLYEMLSERMTACSKDGAPQRLDRLFAPDIERREIIAQLERVRIPRYAGKLMNSLVAAGCDALFDENTEPQTPQITREVFHRISSRIEDEIRTETQDMLELE